ncbi:Bug family tripartite tricarboxylate transporter substrate binding protein [Achromobacter denitrificans]|uniref:Bug family tripartite tricarboxylate transporter substrate binding protein n=1 Tax=Achromobacter denitrificans TaxID=32002 RepID=UPI00166E2F09|nr:tripartite tricarboxylate transporter substrate binding protein [Achromobacter denitrificans]
MEILKGHAMMIDISGKAARRRFCGLIAASAAVRLARAQTPVPLHIVVGFPPGGALDILARVVGQRLTEMTGRPVVVDNQPGAGSLIAAQAVARARPDNTTLLLAPVVVPAFFPALYPKMTFDPIADLTPVAELGDFSLALVAAPTVPASNLAEFIEYVRSRPGTVSYGSMSAGTPSHFLGVMLNRAAGLDMLHIPYKGTAPVLIAVQSGEVQAAIITSGEAVELHRQGRIKVLGVTGKERSPLLPEVATMAQAVPGLRDMEDVSLWYGFFAPRGTAAAQAESLNLALADALKAPAVQRQIVQQDLRTRYLSAAEFGERVRRDSQVWGDIIRETGFKLEQ